MSGKTASLIGIGIVVLLLVEIIGNMVNSRLEEENNNPIDSEGKIKDGYTVSFKEEEKMAIQSFPEVTDKEYNEQLMYAISQCILTSKTLNSYECIGNNLKDSYFNSERDNQSPNEKGEYLYKTLLQGHTPTGVNTKLIETKDEQQIFELSITTLERKTPFSYIFTLHNRKIKSITIESEENK